MARTIAPVDAPARIPSRRASSRAPATASTAPIRCTSSGTTVREVSVTTPAPMPGSGRAAPAPPKSTLPTASTAIMRVAIACSRT